MFKAKYLLHPVESFRTAPFGATFGIFCLGDLAAQAGIDVASSQLTASEGSVLAGLGALVIAGSGSLVRRQFALRERLELGIERHGYDDRLFAPTTTKWCDRQTALVVCENAGHLQAYQQLCEQQAGSAEFTFVPHV